MLNDLAKLTKLVNSKDAVRYQVSKVSVAVAYTIKSTAPPPQKKIQPSHVWICLNPRLAVYHHLWI